MLIRDATPDDWPAIWRFMRRIVAVETNTRAVALWRSCGFEVLATIPEAFRHPVEGYVGLHVMHRRLQGPPLA